MQVARSIDRLICPLTARSAGFSSQFPPDCPEASSIPLYLKLRSIDFGIRSLKGRAEGFRVLGQTHMHCLPEAE